MLSPAVPRGKPVEPAPGNGNNALMNQGPAITHVIPAHNEERFLPRTLESVQRAAAAFGQPVEIIVVDNDSTDRTAEIARAAGARVVFEAVRKIAASRNAGGFAASAPIVSFADADSMVSPNFFTRMARHMAAGDQVGGNFGIRTDRTSLGIALSVGMIMALIRSVWQVGGGSYFCRTETFKRLGGFDPRLDYAEDVAFAKALRLYGESRGLIYVQDHGAYIVTSMRKADRLGDWFALRFLAQLPLRAFRMHDTHNQIRAHFYDFDKTSPSQGFR